MFSYNETNLDYKQQAIWLANTASNTADEQSSCNSVILPSQRSTLAIPTNALVQQCYLLQKTIKELA